MPSPRIPLILTYASLVLAVALCPQWHTLPSVLFVATAAHALGRARVLYAVRGHRKQRL